MNKEYWNVVPKENTVLKVPYDGKMFYFPKYDLC